MAETKYLNLLTTIASAISPEGDRYCQVLTGYLSDAIFLLEMNEVYHIPKIAQKAMTLLSRHLNDIEHHAQVFNWFHGLPGLLWAMHVLKKNNAIDIEMDDIVDLEAVDHYVGVSLNKNFEEQIFDVTTGFLGKALYFLERGEAANIYLERIADFLEDIAVWDSENRCFWIDYRTDGRNDPIINLGLFHGITSIVYCLCKFYKHGIRKEKCEKLITGAINYLDSVLEFYGTLPNQLLYDESGEFSEDLAKYGLQGWCHGLLSTALSYYFSGKVFDNQSWMTRFERLVVKSTEYRSLFPFVNKKEKLYFKISDESTMDIGFCHGIIGNIYMYDKIYSTTGIGQCQIASAYWEEQLIDSVDLKKIMSNNNFSKKGILSGRSGLGMMLLQKDRLSSGKSNTIFDQFVFLDLESF